MSNIYVKKSEGLKGEVCIGGAKNSLLVLLAASILTNEPIEIKNCPKISDVSNMIGILEKIGCSVVWQDKTLYIDSKDASCWELSEQYSKKIRSSIFMLGSVLARFNKAVVCYPGGCNIGSRPIDLHIDGLKKLCVAVKECDGKLLCETKQLTGNCIQLEYPSVGATENIMMAACLAKGVTVIHNAAREPEIIDLAKMLISMGAKIKGMGTQRIIIEGVAKLHGTTYECMPDRIAAGTYIVGAAITRGSILLKNMNPEHLRALNNVLQGMGVSLHFYQNELLVSCNKRLCAPKYTIYTKPYPGFPTDMQPIMGTLLCTARGISKIKENVFDSRFSYICELRKMGAEVVLNNQCAIFYGKESLQGAEVYANDLRGGAALVLAGLAAEGNTVVQNCDVIDRGYEDFTGVLRGLGADIYIA